MKTPKKVKSIQLGIVSDLLASKTTISATANNDMEEVNDLIPGVMAFSKKANRYIKVPMSNIRAIEYFAPEEEAPKKAK